MKKITKIIIGVFSIVSLLAVSSVFAANVWNTSSNDCPTVAIANYTTQTGYVDPCWPLSTVNASPGESINVRIYYHNTSNANNTNVRFELSAPSTTASSTHSFTGKIVSDQGSLYFSPVTVNLSSSQKLTFGSTRWYPNQTQTSTTIPYNQDGSEIIGSGLSIGTIAPGWSTQGSVVISFYVNDPQPTGTITANPNSCLISAGNSTCPLSFTWSTLDPIGISTVINNSDIIIATTNSGTQSFDIPFGNSTYKLHNNNTKLDDEFVSASCASDSAWNSTTSKCVLIVNDCSITSFTADKTNVDSGEAVILTWTTNYCNSVNISGVGTGFISNGNTTVYPTDTITYVLTGFGDTSVTPTSSVEVIAGGPVYAPGFPAGAPGYNAINY